MPTTHLQGDMILITEDEYEDYAVVAIVEAVKDLNMGALAQAYHDQAPVCSDCWDEDIHKDTTSGGFILWLMTNGWVLEHPFRELHVSNYGAFDVLRIVRDSDPTPPRSPMQRVYDPTLYTDECPF